MATRQKQKQVDYLRDLYLETLYMNCSKSPAEVLENYSKRISASTHILDSTEIAMFLGAYSNFQNLLRNNDYVNKVRVPFNNIYELLNYLLNHHSNYPHTNNYEDILLEYKNYFSSLAEKGPIHFEFSANRKALTSLVEKSHMMFYHSRSIGDIGDFIGFRIVVMGEETPELQTITAKIAEIVCMYLQLNSFNLRTISKMKKSALKDDSIEILIPDSSLIAPTLRNVIKDYVYYHKPNGYQAFQFTADSLNVGSVEGQILTKKMSRNANYFTANHDIYKDERYDIYSDHQRLISLINPSEITSIEGFSYITFKDDKGQMISTIEDKVGILSRKPVLFRDTLP